MNGFTLGFIGACWVAWAAYWLIMAFTTKRTVERGGFVGYRLVTLAFFAGLAAIGLLFHVSTRARVWHTSLTVGILADCLVLAGASFTVWARIALGRNWSAEVTFKQDHDLIESGPYALVRHPIYTGLLLMAFSTAIAYGRAIGFALFVSICGGLWWKARDEERIMSSHFPEAYAKYKTRVRAIVPFVL